MRRPASELIFALLAIAPVTAWYVSETRRGIPQPSGFVGLGLGIAGFFLMLGAETLYSLRKRVPGFNAGPLQRWMRWHVVMGLVGPYLVLLHSGWKFHGLAGVLMFLTCVMVASGFVGRYIYTAVPRTLEGTEVAVAELEEQIGAADRQLRALGVDRLDAKALALAYEAPRSGWVLVLGRPWLRRRQRRRLHRVLESLGGDRARLAQLESLLAERYRLLLQLYSLAATRRLLALWHHFHVPLGGVVFTLAFVHIGAALYYAAFSK
jgi:hypothetical protein